MQTIFAQINLVPNSSFEDSLGCPNSPCQLNLTNNWRAGYGTPDYFRNCGTNGYSIPVNYGGYELAHTGVSYIEVAVFHIVVLNGRELIEVKLNDTLILNKKYYVEFYVSLMDNAKYAIWGLGAYFSANGVYGHPLSQILTYVPQVTNTQGNYITNKNGWTKISGTYTANGDERYITIGNFEEDTIIDTLFVDSFYSGPNDWRGSYYYLDDVSVTLIKDTVGVVNEHSGGKIEVGISPNPTDGLLNIKFKLQGAAAERCFTIYNSFGKILVHSVFSGDEEKVDLSSYGKGIYLLQIIEGNKNYTTKVILE